MNCPIHLGEIALDTERAAALPCGHVFCLSCITTCFDVKRAKSEPCPICKKKTRKDQIVKLFLEPKLPTLEKAHVRTLIQHLQTLNSNRFFDFDNIMASSEVDIDRSAVSMTGSPVLKSERLTEEIKEAILQLRTLIIPDLEDLRSIRAQATRLEQENAVLNSSLHLKDTELDNQSRRRISAETNLANLKMAKSLVDDKASSLRETLSVTLEKLKDAESIIREKEEAIGRMEEDIKQYKRWASDNKIKTDKYRAKIKELEAPHKQSEHSPSWGEGSSRGAITDSKPLLTSKMHNNEDGDYIEPLQPPPKRRRTEEKLTSTDMTLVKSCFVTKPPPSFIIPIKQRPEKRTATFSGLNITNDGHVKGPVMLGSRQRMGK